MTQLLIIRDAIKKFASKNETYIIPTGKFILAMISMLLINSKIGYADKLTNFAIVVIAALVCSFLPANFIVLLCGGLMLLHLYSLALECVIVVGVLLMIMYLIYFRFSPKDTILLLLTPVCFTLHIPYVIPISAGLVAGISSGVSVGCGIIIFYILSFINANVDVIKGMTEASLVEKIRFLVDELLFNKEMIVYVAGFAVTIIVVNIIRRLSVDHAWTIAIVIGTLSNIVVALAGDLKFGTYISVAGLILGSVVAVIAVSIIKFFVFNVDYKRTEKVQFEDDEYYYYVKAVPKNLAPKPNKQVKSKLSKTAMNSKNEELVKEAYRKKHSQEGNKIANRNIVREARDISDVPMEEIEERAPRRRNAGDGMSGIEKAAAAKARASRNKRS